jgi:hypothetical protein
VTQGDFMSKANEKLARAIIQESTDYEFFHSSTADYLVNVYRQITDDLNMSSADACDIVQQVWSAAKNEYGE